MNAFQAEILNLLEYPSHLPKNSTKPMLDAPLVKIFNLLHNLNGAMFQLALVLLGEGAVHEEQYPVSLIDLDALAKPYLEQWMTSIKSQIPVVVKRCLEHDKGMVEDESLQYVHTHFYFVAYVY
jgi:hypothetical protein